MNRPYQYHSAAQMDQLRIQWRYSLSKWRKRYNMGLRYTRGGKLVTDVIKYWERKLAELEAEYKRRFLT